MKKKVLVLCLAVLLCLSAFAGCGKNKAYKIAVVPKLTNASWFQRMESGVKDYNRAHGTQYFTGGSAEAEGQAAYLEGLLAEDWDAICVVPYDAGAIAPILEKAKEKGILVITHEAASMDPKYFDYDVEAFEAKEYGENFAKQMIAQTGGEGTYVQYVGSLNSVSHMEWCDAADEYIRNNSKLEKLGCYETNEDMDAAYELTKELLQSHPEISAIQGCSSIDIAGAARAVRELGSSVALVGTSIGSLCKEYLSDGTIRTFSLWDSAEAGKAMLELAEQALEGDFDPEKCTFHADGYENVTYRDGVFYGSAIVNVNAENLADYDY